MKKQILIDYIAGIPATKISNKLGISVDRVRRVIRDNRNKLVFVDNAK